MLNGMIGPSTIISGGGGGAYSGPGDLTGASVWWGLRAYSAAYASSAGPCVDLLDQAGANGTTIHVKNDGTLDVAAIATWVAAHSVTTIVINQLYDQTGNAIHLASSSSLSTRPTLVLGPVTGLASSRPSLLFSGTQEITSTASLTQAQPVSVGSVARRSNTSAGYAVAATVGNEPQIGFTGTANTAGGFAGSFATQTASPDGNFFALHGVFNGAATIMNVDGSSGTAGSTSNGYSSSGLRMGEDSFGNFLTGNVQEGGIWPVALSGPNMTALSANQHAYWGF